MRHRGLREIGGWFAFAGVSAWLCWLVWLSGSPASTVHAHAHPESVAHSDEPVAPQNSETGRRSSDAHQAQLAPPRAAGAPVAAQREEQRQEPPQLLPDAALESWASGEPLGVVTLRQAAQSGDPRMPPLARSSQREQASSAEIADHDKYAAYEARQNAQVYSSFYAASATKIEALKDAIYAAEQVGGLTEEQLAEGRAKLEGLEKMREKLRSEHPDLDEGAE